MQIRPLTAADAGRYNAFLLQGLQEHPEPFRIAPEDIRNNPCPIEGPDDEAFTLAAIKGEETYLGVVAFSRERLQKMRHKGWLVRMYVAASAAGQGVGRALVREVVERARRIEGVEQINLTVIASNDRARQLYASEGFVTFAREARAVRDSRTYRDEEQMTLRLNG